MRREARFHEVRNARRFHPYSQPHLDRARADPAIEGGFNRLRPFPGFIEAASRPKDHPSRPAATGNARPGRAHARRLKRPKHGGGYRWPDAPKLLPAEVGAALSETRRSPAPYARASRTL